MQYRCYSVGRDGNSLKLNSPLGKCHVSFESIAYVSPYSETVFHIGLFGGQVLEFNIAGDSAGKMVEQIFKLQNLGA